MDAAKEITKDGYNQELKKEIMESRNE